MAAPVVQHPLNYKHAVIDHGATLGIDIERWCSAIRARRASHQRRSGGLEHTFGTLLLHHRLTRYYETLPASAASWIRWSMTDVVLPRLTSHTAQTWRDPPPIDALTSTGEVAQRELLAQIDERRPCWSSSNGARIWRCADGYGSKPPV
ncbi:hypothetical protein [Streptomyces griseorubiginosus]|uniref:hypothetical protein n=1 Tax=Streptomyces griseorubiginosus TaxID=67304 RepID=UPI001AD71265|nr:hypothetical protein [Streptomyces griseorubiginosus]MBO4256942.1 hypothetical protein [Streptomyces griseorubiginosus]